MLAVDVNMDDETAKFGVSSPIFTKYDLLVILHLMEYDESWFCNFFLLITVCLPMRIQTGVLPRIETDNHPTKAPF